MTDTPQSKDKLNLQLGDIIDIEAPGDDALDKQRFYVQYIDPQKEVRLLSGTGEESVMAVDENGQLRNESITTINIVSRASSDGYARQNGLVPKIWIDIQFGGDVPAIITGEITNLDEDQIEVKTLEGDTIYLDFAYKGIPEDLPIEHITIRETPASQAVQEDVDVLVPESPVETPGELDEDPDVEAVPLPEVKAQIRELILEAEQIQIGDQLGVITQVVDVPEAEQRFGIEKQTNDMLDELLSTIPNSQRTKQVLNNIHLMIERFKQLRSEYSNFDDQNNALMPAMQGADFKPLVGTLEKLNQKLYWLLPVAKMKKKLYDIDADVEDEYADIVPLTLAETRIAESNIVDNYEQNDVPDGENKYVYLMRSLRPYLTPYTEPSLGQGTITEKTVQTVITAVVDNLDDFYCSVASGDNVRRKRFLIQQYGLGENMLESTKSKGGAMITRERMVTPNDSIAIKSILTLPEPVVRFSHINLPATDILRKSSLNKHFLSYWKLLNKRALISTRVVENLDTPLEHQDDEYLKGIMEYAPDMGLEDDDDNYKRFLEAVVPKTRVLFNLIKKYVVGKLSVYALLQYLEPFMVYQKDVSFMQYKEFNEFIDEKIRDYKRTYVTNSRMMNFLNYNSPSFEPELVSLLSSDYEISRAVFEAYGINTAYNSTVLDGEVAAKMIAIDQGRLFNTALALIGASLMVPDGVAQLQQLTDWVDATEKTIQQDDDECSNYVLAKKYMAMDELEEDNGRDIYFDKRFDKTYYDIYKEYEPHVTEQGLSIPAAIDYVSLKLQETIGLSENDARRDAAAMVSGKRRIEDGDYAVLEDRDSEEAPRDLFYKRQDNTWERDTDISADQFASQNKMFCNLNEKCVAVADKCEDIPAGAALLKNENVKQLIGEFDDNLRKSKEEMTKTIREAYNDALERAPILRMLNERKATRYSREHHAIGGTADAVEEVGSPHDQLRDAILGQGDFAKRQADITKFISYFTRPAGEDEDEWWLYCTSTSTKLLPTFIQKLADAFTMGNNYLRVVEEICATQGTISDDESEWVDKYSGYSIVPISFDAQEGFSDEGFKMKSREILEADFGDAIIQGDTNLKRTFESPDAEKVFNIANAMATFTGIQINPHIEFIMRNSLRMQSKVMPSKERYEKALEAAQRKGKKNLDSYEKTFNQSLIIITLDFFLIAIQTSVPSVRTRKRHPGCVRSFTGYPLGGEEDISGLTYIACIAHKIKSSIEPWDAISKLSQSALLKKMNQTMSKFLVSLDEVQEKIAEKIEYMRLNPEEDIPDTLDVRNWANFLPPLRPVKLGTVQFVSDAFDKTLITDLRTGSPDQLDKINVMRGKIVYMALKIEELVQGVVSKKTAILSNNAGEPFLENSCCDDGNTNTLDYFIENAPEIARFNNEALRMQNVLDDIGRMALSGILFDPRDTKHKYPVIPKEFSEETIYRAFIVYCKYNSAIPISEALRAVCMEKPDSFDVEDQIEEKIRKLKRDGHNYSQESLDQLMQIVNKKNIVHIDFYAAAINSVQIIRDILTSMEERDVQNVPSAFREKFMQMIDTFEIGGLMEDTAEMRSFKNYLSAANDAMSAEIISFLETNSPRGPHRDLLECIRTITDFTETGDSMYIEREDETIHKMIGFIKNAMRSLTRVFPNIIINEVDYASVKIPLHWKLSERHTSDVKDIINKHYSKLYPFYGDQEVSQVMNIAQIASRDIEMLAQNTQFYAPIRDGDAYMYSVFDRRLSILLFKFYFYSVFGDYIAAASDDDVLRTAALRPVGDQVEGMEMVGSMQADAQVVDMEIVSGERRVLAEKVASALGAFGTIICSDKDDVDYNYDSLMERVHRAKEKEKDVITSRLHDMTDEEREVENLFKNSKLGVWSKGLQKGHRIYQQDTYDQERDAMEKQALVEMRMGENNFVTDMNRNIFAMDALVEQVEAERIEAEEMDLGNYVGEDDDYGDMDGDEGY